MERRLAAILAADVVGYSRLMAADEEGTLTRLRGLRAELIDPTIASHHGRIVKLMGDGALVEFASVVDAVRCAVEIQRHMAERNVGLASDQLIAFRIGINLGDVMIEGDDIYGDGVNVAARLEGLAKPGGVMISGTAFDQARNKIDAGFKYLGEQQVKNIPEPVRTYRVLLAPAAAGTIVGEARGKPSRWRWAAAATIVIVVAAASGVVGWLRPWEQALEPGGTLPLPDKPSIAVLPFDNLSANPEEEYFVDGLTDDLITDLSKISGLFVIARNSVFVYKGQAVDTREVARELGVRYLVEGSVRRVGDQLRINAQLIDSETGGHLWADRFERDGSDIFAVQDEVIRHIVDALAVQLSASEQQNLTRLPTTNLEAYDYYLRAEEAARTGLQGKLREALRLYTKATELDPTFAEAFAADARTAAQVMRNNYDNVLSGPVARKRAYEHASLALEINPDAPLPFSVLAVLQVVDGRYDEALESAERAVALAPSDSEAHAALSLVLTFSSRHADAVAAIEKAMRLNPNPPISNRVIAGLAFFLSDDPERAIEMLERASAEAPNLDDVHAMLSAAYARAGRSDAARLAAAEAVRLSPNLCVELYRVILGPFPRPPGPCKAPRRHERRGIADMAIRL
jgi:adenylate cyclase